MSGPRLLVATLLVALGSLARASLAAEPAHPLEPPAVAAPAWTLVEQQSGRVLASHQAEQQRPIASVTKIMTGFVVFEALAAGELTLADRVKVSRRAWKAGRSGSRSFVRLGSQVPVHALLQGMAVQSGNDAAVALAERVAGSEAAFAARMNATSLSLGLFDSHWENASGLDHPQQHSSARDLAQLTRVLIAQHPEGYRYFGGTEFVWDGVRQTNRNPLLKRGSSPSRRGYAGADGVKTGYTEDAGYCMVGAAERDGQRLIVVLLGERSARARAADARALLDWGFAELGSRPADALLDSTTVTP